MSRELLQASEEGREDDVRRLIERGVNVNAVSDWYGRTALHGASMEGHKGVVNILLTAGADVNAVSKNGNTALHCASQEGHKDVANLLLTAGVDVHAVNKNGDTALHYASFYGHVDTVNMLLAAGADVHAVNRFGETALEGRQDVVNVLLAHLAKVYVQSQKKAIVQQTAGATAAVTAGATAAVTAGATSAVTAGATAGVTTGTTAAVTAGATAAVTAGATSAVTAGATAAVTAGATAVTAGAKANLKEEKSKSVKVSNKNEDIVQDLQAVNINVKDKIEQFNELEDKNKNVTKLNRGRLPEADFRTLQEFHVRLKTYLVPFPLIDHLFQRGVINDDELDVIQKGLDKGRAEGVEKMLEYLHFSGKDAFRLFLECLEQEDVGYKDLADELKHHRYARVQADINTLQHFHDRLRKGVFPVPLIDHLFQKNVINLDEMDIIKKGLEKGRVVGMDKMLKILRFSREDDFRLFLECLVNVGYVDLASELREHRYGGAQP